MLGLAPLFLFLSFCWLASAETNLTAEDNEIIWPSSPPLWSSTATVCSSEGQAHFAYQANMSISYEFTGTAIYLRILRSNVTGVYTVTVDNNAPTLIDGFHTTTICDIQFGQTGLSFGPHTVTAKLFGQSPQAQNGPSSYLELDAFIYTTPNDSSSPTSVSPTSASSTTIDQTTIDSTKTSPPTISPSPTMLPSFSTSSKSTMKGSAIAGIVVALIASLVIMAAFFFFIRRRNKRRSMMRRITLVDRDSVFPARISQFPPPASNHAYRTNIHSNSLMHLTDMTNVENQSSLSSSQRSMSRSVAGRDGELEEAPPQYEAPGGKNGLH